MSTVLIQAARMARDKRDPRLIEQVLQEEDALKMEIEEEISYLEAAGKTPDQDADLAQLFDDHGSLVDDLRAAQNGRPKLDSLDAAPVTAQAPTSPEQSVAVGE